MTDTSPEPSQRGLRLRIHCFYEIAIFETKMGLGQHGSTQEHTPWTPWLRRARALRMVSSVWSRRRGLCLSPTVPCLWSGESGS